METEKEITHIMVRCELKKYRKVTEDLPNDARLGVDIRFITQDEKEYDLSMVGITGYGEWVFKGQHAIILKMLSHGKNNLHAEFAETYPKDKEMWINLIHLAREYPLLREQAEYKFQINKGIIENFTMHQLDTILGNQFLGAYEYLYKNAVSLYNKAKELTT